METFELDHELNERLTDALSDSTEFELEAESQLDMLNREDDPVDCLRSPEKLERDRPPPPAASTFSYPDASPAFHAKDHADDTKDHAVVLARAVFRDGGCFEFSGVAEDGEAGFVYLGEGRPRWLEATDDFMSPLRLYCSITPPDAPVPWLLAAIDRQRDRDALLRGRSLCNAVDEVLDAPDDQIGWSIPALPGGRLVADVPDPGPRNYCNQDTGEDQWIEDWCDVFNPFGDDVNKCQSFLDTEVHHSNRFGSKWRRRRKVKGMVGPCETRVRLKHQYRKIFGGWRTVSNRVVDGPVAGTAWFGLIKRKRKIHYSREGNHGSFRAFTVFWNKTL